MKAVVNAPICPLFAGPGPDRAQADEVLFGMVVEVLEMTTPEYWRVRTPYRYEGYAPAEGLLVDPVERWEAAEKQVVLHRHFAQVLAQPRFQSRPLATVPMGALLAVADGETAPPGWMAVRLPDGGEGWVRSGWMDDACLAGPRGLTEEALRARLVELALRYQGAPYRWGGKTPMGVDCSGLVSMVYLLCGISIYRDARLEPGFALTEIDPEAKGPGDVIFFPGHVALYLGGGQYIHATGRAGDDGVCLNSLDPAAPNYRGDLAGAVTHVGSYEGFHR